MVSNTHPVIYAHRGSTLLAPENTREAFDLALQWQCDVLETDVRISLDQQVIVTHDATLERTTDGHGAVASQALAELKRLDASHRFRDSNGFERSTGPCTLLTLDELFVLYPDTLINIDIKDNTSLAAEAVARSIVAHDRHTTVTVGSFHQHVLLKFRAILPSVRTAALKNEVANLYFRRRLKLQPTSKRAFGILQIPESYLKIPLATQDFVQHCQSLGLQICFWTINEPSRMAYLAELGADGIVTDRPDLAAQMFKAD